MKNKYPVTMSAPGKLMLMGDHAVVYGHPCLVTAVNQRIYVTVSDRHDPVLHINAPDVGLASYVKPMRELGTGKIPKSAAFAEAAVRNFRRLFASDSGISLDIRSDFSSEYGFGSSSAVVVGVLAALFQKELGGFDHRVLFDLAFKTVLDVQGVGSGFDVAAAVWGGVIYYSGRGEVIDSLRFSGLPLIVGYSGIKADTATIVREVALKKESEPDKINRIFQVISSLVDEGKKTLSVGEWAMFGDLMNRNQACLRDIGVSSRMLELLIAASLRSGAWGAKLSGAGGGDCVIALAPPDKKNAVVDSIQKAGGIWIDVSVGAPGVRPEITDDLSELFDIVDGDDRVIGAKTRFECHHNSAYTHRTVGILIYNSRGELLMQKRSMTKDMDPGKWGISCAGHVGHGQTYDEAAVRELKEELDVVIPLEFEKKIPVSTVRESEITSVYSARCDGPFNLRESEVSRTEFVAPVDLKKRVQSGSMVLTDGAFIVLKSMGILI